MPAIEELAYREAVRALDGQSTDLEHIRSHIATALTFGGVAIAFFGSQDPGRGDAFIVATVAFATIAIMTIVGFWGVRFGWDFDAYELVTDYVDADPQQSPEFMMRELAVHAGDDYVANKTKLDRLYRFQSVALLAFGVEIAALMYHLALET
jgi:hypothetical protein